MANGTLFVRFGMMGSLFFLVFLFKFGPRLILIVIGKLLEPRRKAAEFNANEGFNIERGTHMGQISAPFFGITEGGEVEIVGDAVTFYGQAPANAWLANPWLFGIARLLLFLVMFAAIGFVWALSLIALNVDGSITAHSIGAVLFLIMIPLLSFLSEGIVRLLTTTPTQIDVMRDEFEGLTIGRVKNGMELIARIHKAGFGQGEIHFKAKHENTIEALRIEMQRFAGVKTSYIA